MNDKSLAEIDVQALRAGRRYFPSPRHWEDEVLYFLLVDRFSDGREGTTPLFAPADDGNAVTNEADAEKWREAGNRFVGGTLLGVQSKLGYLQRLGVTAIWVSPVFKQVPADVSYHGYGIQNFLEIDPNFGTREDLRRLVAAAHDAGIRVILDVILNHTGDVFRYADGQRPWSGEARPVLGFRDAGGQPTLPFGPVDLAAHPDAYPDGAVWPRELQDPAAFTRKGSIVNFDFFPEFADGDFFSLKDLRHGERRIVDGLDQIDEYTVSPTLRHLCAIYKFWIGFADLDGYRIDTVKHMDPGAARFFASQIHEYAEDLGKDNFYLIGEITGGRDFAFDRLSVTGLDAALGISDERSKMASLLSGEGDAAPYFDLFRNSLLVHQDSHLWFRDKIVTSVDDHDHVDQGQHKHRFATGGLRKMTLAALAMNATTLGIPCFYYGTEQLFDGEGTGDFADRYIREAMFGGEFGAFRSRGRHFFDEEQPAYREMAKVHALRHAHLPLRRGRQFLRPISGDGVAFGLPARVGQGPMRSVVAWSRLLSDHELLCAINTDPDQPRRAFVTVDDELHVAGSRLTCLYSTDAAEIGHTLEVEARNGKAVLLTVPAAGFVVYG